MPVYLFTYHGHATWMPDHPRGYVHRQRGLQPPDPEMAANYRRRQRQDETLFDAAVQQLLVDTARASADSSAARCTPLPPSRRTSTCSSVGPQIAHGCAYAPASASL